MNIVKSIAEQVRAKLTARKSASAAERAREIAEARRVKREETQVYPLDSDRRVRRIKDREYASSLHKEQQRGRREHERAQQIDDITVGQTKIMIREFDPALVSPALVRNVELNAVRKAKAKVAAEHPDWSVSQVDVAVAEEFDGMGLEGDRLATLEYDRAAVTA